LLLKFAFCVTPTKELLLVLMQITCCLTVPSSLPGDLLGNTDEKVGAVKTRTLIDVVSKGTLRDGDWGLLGQLVRDLWGNTHEKWRWETGVAGIRGKSARPASWARDKDWLGIRVFF
jgi:hypothetical protein